LLDAGFLQTKKESVRILLMMRFLLFRFNHGTVTNENIHLNQTMLYLILFTLLTSFVVSDIDEGPVCSTSQKTFESYEKLILTNEVILHCGPCGACSNNHDINIYVETRNTLTKTTGNCAILSLIDVIEP
jgi:hypothetical protein